MIKEILISELNILKQFEALLEDERKVLLNNESSKLLYIIEEKKNLALELSKLERKRKDIYGNKTANDLINEGLVDEEFIDEFTRLTEIIKEKNELNALLTKQSLSYIKMYTNLLSKDNKIVTYKGTGKVDESVQSIFNTTI
ncbi:flagellar protein FlgN [Caloramator sp. mosi_1]|uniref:flagellar protein FlgN n=1 Tax=Caloramator sp. mosi_1 TaxID=3023090 RepID=UPI00236044D9|nr:flagellar protein FlgN [Caloramator sp. mosi_1]WDC83919.1 flagellar protein FlgN [Caloramator sp. mosi_1]